MKRMWINNGDYKSNIIYDYERECFVNKGKDV